MGGPSLVFLSSLLALLCLVPFITAAEQSNSAPPASPTFVKNYYVRGVLSLPYAELSEPFSAYYDLDGARSRIDFYGDLYQLYQFGPKSAPVRANKFGAMYKLLYVPAGYHPHGSQVSATNSTHRQLFSRLSEALHRIHRQRPQTGVEGHTDTRRACLSITGGVGLTVSPQSVLPDLTDFQFDSYGPCPAVNAEHKRKRCELWKYVNTFGEKKNTYKFWLRRDDESGLVVPVHYYMLGYDSLIGSHFDRYDVTYYDFRPEGANEEDFGFDVKGNNCEEMVNPGDTEAAGGSEAAQWRAHLVEANPLHEVVSEPHRYDHIDHEFDKFKSHHQKEYESDKHQRRGWMNFLHNSRLIKAKNRELKSYKLGVNRYADNNLKELAYLRGRMRTSSGNNGGLDYEQYHNLKGANGARALGKLPETWDWTRLGAVNPVKDQAVCGSCWSFGTSGSVEGANFVKTGKLLRLSQQQMVDCSWPMGNYGCDGGLDFQAYNYIMKAGGLATEEDYGHYMGVDGKCHHKETPKAVKIKGFYNVTANSVDALKHAIVTYGPVNIGIDASQPTFTFYSHGVYYDEKCKKDPNQLDHQVLVVGYMKVKESFVWIVKNSWSTYWGDDGYILMSAENNNCGVMDAPTVPIIE